jgi:hypothetical protein
LLDHQVTAVRVPPQQHEPRDDEEVSGGVEQPVPERVHLQVAHAVGRVAAARQHVVPLQDLVEHDAVEEAAEAEPEENSRGRRKSLLPRLHGVLLPESFAVVAVQTRPLSLKRSSP